MRGGEVRRREVGFLYRKLRRGEEWLREGKGGEERDNFK